jgi:acrylyl-CoA reductase (NADPH)
LGVAERVERKEFAGPAKHLGKACWAGVVDPVGSTTRANVLAMTRYSGAVVACGLAGGMDLPTSVAPFILRGASLLGFESLMRPIGERHGEVWRASLIRKSLRP